MKLTNFSIFILCLLFVAVSACSIRPKASALHDLGYANGDNGITETVTQTDNTPPVTVESPKWLEDSRIRYRLLFSAPTQVRSYAMDRWIASPPELFEQLLKNSRRQWQTPLMIELTVFEQQFDTPTSAKVVMHFTVTTVPNEKSAHSSKKEFKLRRACATADANGAVNAFADLTRQAIEQIQAWLMLQPL